MSSRSPVLWKDGLFVKPQHFQQMADAGEATLHHRIGSLTDAFYGFSELELNREYLSFGKVAIVRARGVMPDGTVFDIPGDMPPPAPLEIPQGSAANKIIHLALPLRCEGVQQVRWPDSELNSRYVAQSIMVMDTHSAAGDTSPLDVALPNLQLKLDSEDLSAYTCLALAGVLDRHPDGSVVLSERFYPTCTSLKAVPRLLGMLEEIAGLMRERARNLAARICSPSQSGVADVTDFNLLQVLNRLHPYFQHLARRRNIHPEQLYIALSQACGELVTFTDDGRLPQQYPAYQHDNLIESFQVLEDTLRRTLGTILQPRAVSLPINEQPFGVRTALLHEQNLLEEADFILAVRARLPADELRQRFLLQAKITSIENLTELIRLQLPGIALIPQPVAPRHLPYHAGFSYFELDRHHPAWNSLKGSSGFGLHIAGEFPDLELQFWAIRGE